MEKEILLRKMRLSKKQDNVSNLAVSNNKERKQIWEEWKKQHPESKKIWRSERAKDPNTLRCQAAVIIKKYQLQLKQKRNISKATTVTTPEVSTVTLAAFGAGQIKKAQAASTAKIVTGIK